LTELPTAYDGSGDAWARGASRLYDRLARCIIEPFSTQVRGAMVLDAGAGTGAVCRALRGAGASAVAVDSSADMLAHIGDAARHAVAGDLYSLPFRDASFDGACSAFTISHLDRPARALRELRRVIRPSGLLVVAVFGAAPTNASRDVIYDVAADYGFAPPAWYIHLKTHTEPLTNTPTLLLACSREAGLDRVTIDDVVIDSELSSPDEVVAYRTGMAQLAPFVNALSVTRREGFLRDAATAVRDRGQPVRPRVLIMSSRASA
jgi:SAM-dependent methyltransferase